jgi:hypothetical protein
MSFNYKDSILDAAANSGDAIYIKSTLNGNTVAFKPFITTFNDDSNIQFQEESVFGRMDDLLAYQKTSRNITIGFDCPSYNEQEAFDNMLKVQLLKQWIYPTFGNDGNALSMSGAPLFRVRYLNLIYNEVNAGGLLCKLGNLAFSPNLQEGSYVRSGELIPKTFSLSFNLKILHELTPKNVKPKYPYNLIESRNRNLIAQGETIKNLK